MISVFFILIWKSLFFNLSLKKIKMTNFFLNQQDLQDLKSQPLEIQIPKIINMIETDVDLVKNQWFYSHFTEIFKNQRIFNDMFRNNKLPKYVKEFMMRAETQEEYDRPSVDFILNKITGKPYEFQESVYVKVTNSQEIETNNQSDQVELSQVDFILNVEDFSTKNDWKGDMYRENGVTVGIAVHLKANPTTMYDDSFISLFPELEDLDLYEEGDGFLTYYGDENPQDLIKSLNELGFVTNFIP